MNELLLLAKKYAEAGIALEVDPAYPGCIVVKFPLGTARGIKEEFNKGQIRRRVLVNPGSSVKHYLQPEDEKPIEDMTRKQLNDKAKKFNVTDPEKFANKEDVVAAICKAMTQLISSQ